MSQNQDGELGRKLKRALSQGDFITFKRLVKGGVNVNATYWFDSTLLHEAVQINNAGIVKLLLQNKARIDSKNQDGRTALHLACRGGLVNIVNLLLQHGADVNLTSDTGQTALHLAAWRKHTETARLLIQAGADVNVQDKYGCLPLHWGAEQECTTDLVKILLENGSRLDAPLLQKKGSLLVDSMLAGHCGMTQLFISHGGSTDGLPNRIVDVLKCEKTKYKTLSKNMKEMLVQELVRCECFATKFQLQEFINSLVNSEKDRENLFLENEKKINQSLSSICRSKVRRLLLIGCGGKSIYSAVHDLQLPHMLKEYILFIGQFTVFVKR